MAKKSSTVQTVKTARKLYKRNPKLFIAIVAVIVIIAIAFGVIYYTHPEWFATPSPKSDELNTLPESGELKIYFLDIGQGDCIYIAFPDGKDMLIDCGSEGGTNAYKTSILADLSSLVADGTIDYFMLTHGDTDHISYADEVFGSYQINNVYMPNVLAEPSNSTLASEVASLDSSKLNKFTDEDTLTTGVYAEFFIAALLENNCNIILNVGDFVISGEDYTFSFSCFSEAEWDTYSLSSAEKKNAISPIGILEYAGRKIVFTGDSNEMNEEIYCDDHTYQDCDVLKVAHHGSESSSTKEFLDLIDCEYAVISVGEGNSYGHPTSEALGRLNDQNMTIYRTDRNGNITLTIDHSGEMNFETEKVA